MAFNITTTTGSHLSLSKQNYQTTHDQGLRINPEHNDGYALGKLIRKASEKLLGALFKTQTLDPSETDIKKKKALLFLTRLKGCVKKLELAVVNLNKNTTDSNIKKVLQTAKDCAPYFELSDDNGVQEIQFKLLKPLAERIYTLAYPKIRGVLEELLPIFLQQKELEKTATFERVKRSIQQPTPPAFDLSTLNGVNGFAIDGLQSGSKLGWSTSCGDINNDGFVDIIIGAPYASPSGLVQAGSVYVIFGKSSGWPSSFNLATLDGTNGFVINGRVAADTLGYSVSSALDINGDGTSDLLLGMPTVSNGINKGLVYVIFGKSAGWTSPFNLAQLNGANGFVINGFATDIIGWAVSTAGDINQDGISDLLIGAPTQGAGGSSYVLFGNPSGWSSSFDLTTINGTNGFEIGGLRSSAHLGCSISAAGDVNKDGISDIIIGANYNSPSGLSGAGSAFILFGQSGGWPSFFNLTLLNGTNGFKVDGVVANGFLGTSVSAALDINQDGVDDIALQTQQTAGAYVLLGHMGGWPSSFDLTYLDGTSVFSIFGLSSNSYSVTQSISGIGDINNDGISDLAVGGSSPLSAVGCGAAFVLFGQSTWPAAFDVASLNGTNGFMINGLPTDGNLGYSISGNGDINKDGIVDLILGAPQSQNGRVYVLFGRNQTLIPVSPTSSSFLSASASSTVTRTPTSFLPSSLTPFPSSNTATQSTPVQSSTGIMMSASSALTPPSSLGTGATPIIDPINVPRSDLTVGLAAGISGFVVVAGLTGLIIFLKYKKKACFAPRTTTLVEPVYTQSGRPAEEEMRERVAPQEEAREDNY